jgi:hypothetical protein
MGKTGIALGLVLGLAATGQSSAQLREYPDQSLAGVRGVHVVVRYQAPNEHVYGLTESDLKHAIETRLAADNVKVLDDTAWRKEPGEPYLFVNVVGTMVDSARQDRSPFVFSFSADLIQNVMLASRPDYSTAGATWSQGYFVVVPKENLREVTLQISNVAHDFAESLHEANRVVRPHTM